MQFSLYLKMVQVILFLKQLPRKSTSCLLYNYKSNHYHCHSQSSLVLTSTTKNAISTSHWYSRPKQQREVSRQQSSIPAKQQLCFVNMKRWIRHNHFRNQSHISYIYNKYYSESMIHQTGRISISGGSGIPSGYFFRGQHISMSTKCNDYSFDSNSDDRDDDPHASDSELTKSSQSSSDIGDNQSEYIDYIASYYDSNNQNENKNDESLIQQLFDDDYPSTLPLTSHHEKNAFRRPPRSFSSPPYQNKNHPPSYQYQQQPKNVPSSTPPPRANPPKPIPETEQPQSLTSTISSPLPQSPSSPSSPSPFPIHQNQQPTSLPSSSIPNYDNEAEKYSIVTSPNTLQPTFSHSNSKNDPIQTTLQTTEKEYLQFTIQQIQSSLYKHNNNISFNINSPKQVSKLLFGVENESTSRDVLEGLMGNLQPIQVSDNDGQQLKKNIGEISKLILEFRRLTSKLKKIEKEEKHKENGTHVNHGGDVTLFKETSLNNNDHNGKKDRPFVPNELTLGHKYYSQHDNANGNNTNNTNNINIIEPLVLIDASAYIFRAYYSMPAIHRFDGEPTGATLGFCNMLNRLILTPSFLKDQMDTKVGGMLPPRIVLVFDSKDGTNFRKKLYPEYKANRKACPIDLIPQFDHVRDAADAYGILQLEAAGYEADDVIATIATKALEEGCFVNILSGDKDLMQLVTQDHHIDDDSGQNIVSMKPCIQLIDPMNMIRFDYKGVIEKWGVQPEQLGDVLALAGDKSDNIPGVPGIGPKIAANLINEYGSLNGLLENIDTVKQKGRREKLKESVELAFLSKKLVELERNVPMQAMSIPSHFNSVSDFRMKQFNPDRLLSFYDRMGFRDLKNRVKNRIATYGPKESNSHSTRNDNSKVSFQSNNNTNVKYYDSILEKKSDNGRGAKAKISERYSSILKTNKSSNNQINDDSSSMGKHNNNYHNHHGDDKSRFFSNAKNFTVPPDPEEFMDVPF